MRSKLSVCVRQLNIDLFKKTLGPVEKALGDAGLDMSEVHEVVLVGGSTRIPKVTRFVSVRSIGESLFDQLVVQQ